MISMFILQIVLQWQGMFHDVAKKKCCFDRDVIQFRQHPSFKLAVCLFTHVLQEFVPGYLDDFVYFFLHNWFNAIVKKMQFSLCGKSCIYSMT